MTEPSERTEIVDLQVWSDIACPWCFIGKRRLERALADEPEGSVRVRWRAFELNGTIPEGGLDARQFYIQKFGGEQRMRDIFAHVTAVAAGEGIGMDFGRMRRAPNTRLAHRLIALAAENGRQAAAVEALFRGHFEKGANVGDLDEALALLDSHGTELEVAALREAVARGEGRESVEGDIAAAVRLGIASVPFFVAASRYAVSGAQAPAAFTQLIAAASGRIPVTG